ncbi:MAG: hypothetical protein PWQ57_1209 [Desulfovibrionales bacterium]|nr:hypothetical protein [Desulfovibrionales bacterium]
MKRALILLCAVLVVMLSSGCVQKVKIKMLQPGELKLSGVSKIALLSFNSIKPDVAMGSFAADRRTCELARQTVADVLSSEPHYQLVDLDVERSIARINSAARPESRLDAVLYGRVWWQVSDENKNFEPAKINLRAWTVRKYVCGHTDGKPVYCTAELTTKRWDEFYQSKYRAVTASLMLGLSLYRVDKNGRVAKVAHTFVIAKRPAMMFNGEYSKTLELLNVKAGTDRTSILKGEDVEASGAEPDSEQNGVGASVTQGSADLAQSTAQGPVPLQLVGGVIALTGGIIGAAASTVEAVGDIGNAEADEPATSGKSQLEKGVVRNEDSVPPELAAEDELLSSVANRLKAMIQPHSVDFDVVVAGQDKKTKTLLITEAYAGAAKYLSTKIMGGYRDLAAEMMDTMDFEGAARQVVLRDLKKDHDADQADKAPEARTPFVPPADEDLARMARNHLSGCTKDMYNLGLSLEGTGDFERALELYRYAFYNFASSDQDMADGLGRCLLALDLSDRVVESEGALDAAKDHTKLK